MLGVENSVNRTISWLPMNTHALFSLTAISEIISLKLRAVSFSLLQEQHIIQAVNKVSRSHFIKTNLRGKTI
jgi:hypothetical protein